MYEANKAYKQDYDKKLSGLFEIFTQKFNESTKRKKKRKKKENRW